MAEEKDDGAGKEFSLENPLIGKLNLKGYHLGNLLQMAITALLCVIAYMAYDAKQATAVAANIGRGEHEKISAAIERNTESQNEMGYILTLNQTQRERLNLERPESLRRKIIGRDR